MLLTGVLLVSCSDGRDKADDHGVLSTTGSARFPHESAADWVTYADHVVVATVTSDRALPLGEAEHEHDEGSVDRSVEMVVDELVWSADAPRQEAPTAPFEMIGWGWALQDGERVPIWIAGSPRLEVGHTYIVALVWLPERADEPMPIAAHWDTLGPESIVPYDDETIGVGEGAESGTSTGTRPVDAYSPETPTVERQLAGEKVEALASLLEETEPMPREDFG